MVPDKLLRLRASLARIVGVATNVVPPLGGRSTVVNALSGLLPRRRLPPGAQPVPPAEVLMDLCGAMASVRLEDFKMRDLPKLCPGGVQFLYAEQSDIMTIAFIRLAPGGALPLHDHPHMSVVSALLRGTMHVTCFDPSPLELGEHTGVSTCTLSRAVRAGEEGSVWTTLPSHMNLHAMINTHATEEALFLDVIAPPYDEGGELPVRPCTYFDVHQPLPPFASVRPEACAVDAEYQLRVRRAGPPAWFEPTQLQYTGEPLC